MSGTLKMLDMDRNLFGDVGVSVRVRCGSVCTRTGDVSVLTRFGGVGVALVISVELVDSSENTGDGILICCNKYRSCYTDTRIWSNNSCSKDSDLITDINDMSLGSENFSSNVMNEDDSDEINKNDQSFLNYGDQSILFSEGSNRSMSFDKGISISEGDKSNLILEMSSNKDVFENILKDISEPEMNANYPNKAYGRKYMDNIKLPNMTYHKTCIINYNNDEYYLHYQPLINCIKSILSISDISENFTLSFEKLKKNAEISLPMDAKLLSLILYSNTTNVDNAVHEAFHKSLEMLLDPVLSLNDGIDLDLNNEKICYINIYKVIVTGRMHHLDLGLFHYLIEYTRDILKNQHGNSLVDEIDRRLVAIPRFTGLKVFTNGLQSIARLTADEHHNLMKVMVFVIDNLYKENTKNIKNFIKNKDLVQFYKTWNECMKSVDMKYLKKKSIDNWSQRFIKAFQSTSPFRLKLLKLHSWLSNKKNVKTQIMQMQLIANVTSQSTNLATTPRTFNNISVCMNSEELFEYTSDQDICYDQNKINYKELLKHENDNNEDESKNPLLTELNTSASSSYELFVLKLTSLSPYSFHNESVFFSNLTYIDDSTLISSSFNGLAKLLNIMEEFYYLNNTSANHKKYILISNVITSSSPITFPISLHSPDFISFNHIPDSITITPIFPSSSSHTTFIDYWIPVPPSNSSHTSKSQLLTLQQCSVGLPSVSKYRLKHLDLMSFKVSIKTVASQLSSLSSKLSILPNFDSISLPLAFVSASATSSYLIIDPSTIYYFYIDSFFKLVSDSLHLAEA
ncbi:hypothetical protein C1645_833386 [Glomus cerebriforme]|uniref:Uncharacterized protein n=1 Tax=Glomus cerebriforme TaxID=658196 RepID=A0A397SFQ2_9GLOM|nr:hypothetical protein C1645_833386 [Glomus cerebriforme]